MADTRTTKFFLDRLDAMRPRAFPRSLHKIDRNVYGLEEFPIKVILLTFQEIFSDFDKYKWSAEKKESNIFIRDKLPEKATQEELKPAIITERGAISPKNINGRGRNWEFNAQTGLMTFSDMLTCPMTIHCLSKSGIESGEIASAVMAVLMHDEDVMKEKFGIHALLSPTMGPEGEFLTDSQITLQDTPVYCTIEWAWSWARKSDNGRLVDTVVDLRDPQG